MNPADLAWPAVVIVAAALLALSIAAGLAARRREAVPVITEASVPVPAKTNRTAPAARANQRPPQAA